jgi:PAS domain S-box-containing protein
VTAWVVLILSFVLTALAWHISDRAIRANAEQRFRFQTEDIASAITKRLLAYETALRGGSGLFNASDQVDRREWHTYVSDLKLQQNFPGIQGLGFSLMVAPSDRDKHIAAIRADGFPSYTIRPEGERDMYSSVIYIEPFDWRNQRAFGYDMLSERVRRDALEQARDSGEPAVSGRVKLVQETTEDVQYGFLMCMPVYEKGRPVGTVEERRAALRGFVYSPFRAKDFMKGILGADQGGIDFELYDGEITSPETLLFDHVSGGLSDVQVASKARDALSSLVWVKANQRVWSLRVHAHAGYLSGSEAAQPLVVAISGAVIDLFLFWIITSIGRQKRLAEGRSSQLAARLEESEGRYGALFESARAAMLLTDAATGAILEANPGACAFYGYDQTQMCQMKLWDFNVLSPAEVLAEMQRAKEVQQECFVVPHRLASGEVRQVEVHSGSFQYGGKPALYSILHDVTGRKQMEVALIASERRYAYVLSAVGDGIWDWDIVPNKVSHNQRWGEILGIDNVPADHPVEEFASLIHEEDRPAVLAAIEATLSGRGPYRHLHRMRHAGGHCIWVLDRGQVVERGPDGSPLRMVGSLIDATVTMEQELALKDERRRLQNVIDGTRAGTWEWNVQTGEVIVNAHWAEIIGFTQSELSPFSMETWLKAVHPDDLRSSKELLARHFSGDLPYYECEARMRHKDGHWVWVLDRGKVATWAAEGKPLLMSGTHQDISLRKVAEERQRQSELLLRSAIETIGEAFVVYDPQDRLVFFNEEYRAFYATSAAVIESGRTFEEIIRYGVERAQYQDAIGREEEWVTERLAAHREGDHQLVQKLDDGRWLRVRERRTPTGHIVGFRVDVTEFYRAKEAAEAANIAKSRFLATMSHEIRTPLNGMLGMAQLLLTPQLSDTERQEYARIILNSGQTLLSLLNDILDLSKIEAGKVQLESTPFEPQQILREVMELFAATAHGKQLELEVIWHGPDRQRYRGDPHRLRAMLSNLVGNAIKFTALGHVRVEAREIERESGSDGTTANLEFAISDTGMGIPRDKQQLLFQPFSQADSSATRQFGGSGLGLSIVRSLARLMGGEAGVDSEVGRGSRFWFRIPAATVAAGEDRRRAGRQREQLAKSRFSGRVLLVDDNVINLKVMELQLRKLGLTVAPAADGKQGVEAITGGDAPDLVLMDLQMPVLDGCSATEQIRQWEAANGKQRLPIIALTADAFEESRQHTVAAGMDDFLTKPIDMDRLNAILSRWLRTEPAQTTPTTPTGAG